MNTKQKWSEDRIATLTKMRSENAPFSAIGNAFGISRNSAIGKANRLGLSVQRVPSAPRPRTYRRKASPAIAKGAVTSAPPKPVKAQPAREEYRGLPLFHPVSRFEHLNPPPAGEGKTIVAVGYGECRYMSSSAGTCCGQPTGGGSWCGYHKRMVYSQAKKRAA